MLHSHYPWAVYCEGPPNFIWLGGWKVGAKKGGTIIPVYNSHIHIQNAQTAKARTLCVYYYRSYVPDVHGVCVYTTRYSRLISNTWYTHIFNTCNYSSQTETN